MASNSSNNKVNVPEAKQAMSKMKHEVASELGITLNNGYNGDITSKNAGYIGGTMVNKRDTGRTKIITRFGALGVPYRIEYRYFVSL